MIYFLKRENGDIKIGTTVNMNIRLPQLTSQYGELEILGFDKGNHDIEAELHERFKEYRQRDTDWFTPHPALENYIKGSTTLEFPDAEVTFVGIKISRHSRYVLDIIAAHMLVQDGKSHTYEDAIWEMALKHYPELAQKAVDLVGPKIVPKRGHAKKKTTPT